MKRKTLKKALSAFLSLLMCMMTLLSISTPVFAATTVDAYMVDFPRDGDSNYSATAWGHSATSLMGGWRFLNSKYTTVHSIGTYNGQVSYCIEPGGQNAGDTLSHKDETFWENYPSHLNPTISPDTIKVLLGRIMQYGYQGNVSTSWRSQNASDAAALSHIIATQLLVWETVVGERDASFPPAMGRARFGVISGTSIRFAARSAPIIIPWPPACRVTQKSPASAHEALAAHAAMNSNTTARDIP